MREIKPPFQVVFVQYPTAEFLETVAHDMFYSFFFFTFLHTGGWYAIKATQKNGKGAKFSSL